MGLVAILCHVVPVKLIIFSPRNEKNITFVSVHVRRTDYTAWMIKGSQGKEVSRTYYLTALEYARSNFTHENHKVISWFKVQYWPFYKI